MKRECRYVLDEEEITCIGDIRTAKNTVEKIVSNMDSLEPEEIAEMLKTCDERLSVALKKLEIN